MPNYLIRKVMDNKQQKDILRLMWGYKIKLDPTWLKKEIVLECEIIGSNLTLDIGVIKEFVNTNLIGCNYIDIYTHDRYYCLEEDEENENEE